jgi:hypothetical protein
MSRWNVDNKYPYEQAEQVRKQPIFTARAAHLEATLALYSILG